MNTKNTVSFGNFVKAYVGSGVSYKATSECGKYSIAKRVGNLVVYFHPAEASAPSTLGAVVAYFPKGNRAEAERAANEHAAKLASGVPEVQALVFGEPTNGEALDTSGHYFVSNVSGAWHLYHSSKALPSVLHARGRAGAVSAKDHRSFPTFQDVVAFANEVHVWRSIHALNA